MPSLCLLTVLAMTFAVSRWTGASNVTTPAFAVASLKLSDPGRRQRTVTNGSLVIRCESLLNLIAWSFGIDRFRIIGPDWIQHTTYNLNAKADGAASEQEIKVMLKGLLADRLELTIHFETRRVLLIAMDVAKSGLKVRMEDSIGSFEMIRDGDRVSLRNATFADLARFLGADGSRVFDHTGISGKFNISLDYRRYLDPNDSSTHALAAAWQEAASRQIGLRFREQGLKVAALVIDHVRREPAAN